MSNIISAAEITNADAIHPGYEASGECGATERCEHDIKFIGASPEMISKIMATRHGQSNHERRLGAPCTRFRRHHCKSEQCKKIVETGHPVML
jgi:acetyl-CoA carboxylase biotin carboxylase subunit